MTVKDLDNQFKLYLNKVDSMAVGDFLAEEREVFLNDAQLFLAKASIRDQDSAQGSVNIRRTLSRRKELELDLVDGRAMVPLPKDYLDYGRSLITFHIPGRNDVQVKPELVSEDEFSNMFTDPFNTPQIGSPILCFTENALLAAPSAAKTIQLTYYKIPTRLSLKTPNQESELPEASMPSLVWKAVGLALESIADPRFQTQAATVAPLT